MARGGFSVAPDDDAAEMYLQGLARLDAAGYAQYEISNVARPGFQSRHNLKYWQGGSWLGFGCGAHATWNGVRWRNLSSTTEYVGRLAAGETVRIDERALSPGERVEEALFMGLRLTQGVDLSAIRDGLWCRCLAPLQRRAVSVCRCRVARGAWPRRTPGLTRQGMLLANEIMMVFIGGAVR